MEHPRLSFLYNNFMTIQFKLPKNEYPQLQTVTAIKYFKSNCFHFRYYTAETMGYELDLVSVHEFDCWFKPNNQFSLQLFIMHLEEHLQEDSLLFQALIFALLLLVTYVVHKKSQTKKRLTVMRSRPSSSIEKQKIIVACELEQLFVTMSDCKRHGFHKINMRCTGFAHLLVKIKELIGLGIYYKPKTSVRNIKNFLQSLAQNPKVQLFLYTTLNLSIAEQIIQRLCLKTFFKPEYKRSCNDGYSEPLKHPTEVDFNTKRVIIVTGSKKDHLEEDSKYFLVVKRKELGDSIKILNRIITKNSNIDQLHNQLGEVKAQIESDYE